MIVEDGEEVIDSISWAIVFFEESERKIKNIIAKIGIIGCFLIVRVYDWDEVLSRYYYAIIGHMNFSSFLQKIKKKKVAIGIIGLGYVGLPLAILFAKKGFRVTGFLRDRKKIVALENGESYLTDLDIQDDLTKVIASKSLRVTTMNTEDAKKQDVFIVCVPTPINKQYKPDIEALRSVAEFFGTVPLQGKLIINESTVAPGMTRSEFGHFRGQYYLVCSPERVDPGNKEKPVAEIPKIVGGINRESQTLAQALYESVLHNPVVVVKSPETAEMTKMLENTYRAVNIGLINEFAVLCESSDVDILEVVGAAKTKWSYHPHYPGIGVGGHCIPVDPYYLVEYAKQKNISLSVTSAGLRRNEEMADYVFHKLLSVYKKGADILVYGIAYKKNVKDLRESPVLRFCSLLEKQDISFTVYDPFLTKDEMNRLHYRVGALTPVDILIIGTDHDALEKDAKKLVRKNTVIIDGRNFFKKKIGKAIYGVGRTII